MIKSTRKLVLRRESLRTLTRMDLSRAAGGADGGTVQVFDTGDKACRTESGVLGSGDAACTAMAVTLER